MQRYDARGHPENNESRRLARRSRYAQNDILATIGVCVSIEDQADQKGTPGGSAPLSKADHEQARINIEEHTIGFWFEGYTELAYEILTKWVVYVRRRTQACSLSKVKRCLY